MENYTLFLTTLDGSSSIHRPKFSMNFLHSVIFTIKMGSWFSLFSATRSVVIKTGTAAIVSRYNIYDTIPSLSPSILYYHILTLLILYKNSASALRGTWDMMKYRVQPKTSTFSTRDLI